MAHADLVRHLQAVVHEKNPDLADWAFAREVFNKETDPESPEYREANRRWAAEMQAQHEASTNPPPPVEPEEEGRRRLVERRDDGEKTAR